jgi:hypothetical protein
MSTPSEKRDYSLRNFPSDVLTALGLPIVVTALLASWVLSIHGVAWMWAAGISVSVAVLGAVLLFIAKLPVYRQGRFFTFGIQALPVTSHRLYRWGCRLQPSWNTRDVHAVVGFDIMALTPNHPAAGKAGIDSRLAIGHHWPGLPEPGR